MTYRASITVQTRRDPRIPRCIRESVERSGGLVECMTATWKSEASTEFIISVLLENPERLIPLIQSVDDNRGVAVEEVGRLRRIDRVVG